MLNKGHITPAIYARCLALSAIQKYPLLAWVCDKNPYAVLKTTDAFLTHWGVVMTYGDIDFGQH